VHAARSTLEVKTRRLLVANGFTDFVRELPLVWRGRTYYFDFAFPHRSTILETNGRRWHDDARATPTPRRAPRDPRRVSANAQTGASPKRASTNFSIALITVYRINE
jgi:hypothetical protein